MWIYANVPQTSSSFHPHTHTHSHAPFANRKPTLSPHPLDCLKRWQSDHTCYHPHRFNELATKSEKWIGKPWPECVNQWSTSASKTPVSVLPWACRSEGNDPADWLAGKATLKCGLRLGKFEVLRSLKHYLRAQSQGHHTIDRLEERGVEKGSARGSSWKTRKGHRQSDEHWNCLKGNVGKTERRGGAHVGFFERTDTILN